MLTHDRAHISLLLFSIYKSRFVAHNLGYRAKKKGEKLRGVTAIKKGYGLMKRYGKITCMIDDVKQKKKNLDYI